LLRKAAVGLAILAILVLAGLVAAPYLINLDYLKAEIASKVHERTGRTLTIAGPIRLALLPTPAVDARDVRLANPPGAVVRDMVRLRAVEVKLAFWPLLTGRIEVRSAELVEPDIDVERLPSGAWNWQAARSSAEAAPGAGDGAAPTEDAASFSLFPFLIRDLAVQNGRITYRSRDGVEPFEHINATLRLDARQGPFHATGALVARGASLEFTAVGGEAGGGALPLHVTVSTTPAAQLDFGGTLSGLPDAPKLTGSLKVSTSDLAAVAATFGRLPMPAALAQPLSVSGQLGASAKDVTIDRLAVDLGTAHADGRVSYTPGAPPSLGLSLHIASLDVDRWLAARKASGSGSTVNPAAAAGAPAASATIPSDTRPVATKLVIPDDLAAHIDLTAEAILWRGGILRQMRLQSALADGTFRVERVSALLPGSTEIAWKGKLATPKGTPRADGHLDATSDNLRELLGWLGIGVGQVPPDRLRRASISSDTALVGDRLDLSDAEVSLDATRARAAAIMLLRQRLGIGLRLAADHFNLDAYLPSAAADAASGGRPAAPSSSAPSSAPPAARNIAASFGVDVNLDARLRELTWRGQPLRDIHLAGVLQNGGLSVKDLTVGDVGGATLKLSGLVDDAAISDGAFKGQLAFDAKGPELARVLHVFFRHAPTGQSFGAFTLGGALQANDGRLAIDSELKVPGGRLHVVGDAILKTGGVNMAVDVDHPSAERLLRAFYPTYHAAGGDPGALKLSVRVTGAGAQYDLKALSLAVGQSTLEGNLGVALGGARPKVTGDLSFGDWAIDRLLPAHRTAAAEGGGEFGLMPGVMLAQAGSAPPRAAPANHWSAAPLDLAVLKTADAALSLKGHSLAYGPWQLDQPAMMLTLQDGALTVGQLTGQLFGGSLAAQGGMASQPQPSLKLELALKGADLKAALAAAAGVTKIDGRFDLDAAVTGAGTSEADLVAHLDGQASVKGRDGTFSGVDLKAVGDKLKSLSRPADLLSLLKAGTGGTTHFSTLDGTFHLKDGVATTDDLHLVSEGAEGKSTMKLDLPAWTIASRIEFQLTGVDAMPPLVMHLDGPLDDPRKVFDVNALSQFLVQRFVGKAAPPSKNATAESQDDKNKWLHDLLKGLTPHP
jgi:uncharacterized protein involved in outer membrane biogenesis